ncbi:TolC family protein, partial [bacterium]
MRPSLFLWSGLALNSAAALAQDIPPTPPLPPVVAEAPNNEPELFLAQLIELAVKNNPRGLIARENLSAAQQRAGASRAYINPILQMVPGFTGDRNARDEEVILSQQIDLFGLRRARFGVTEAEVRRSQAEIALADRSLRFDIKTAAIALFAAQETEALERVQVDIAKQFRDAAARRAELGDVPPIQVQRAELELLRLENNLANASVQRLTQRAALNWLIGESPDKPLRVALPLNESATAPLRFPVVGATPGSPETGIERSGPSIDADLAQRPDIMSARATVALRQAQARAVKRENMPTVQLQARRSAFFGRDGSSALRAVVTLPLFDF